MSMIKCMECGGNISDKATKCPHCGILLINEKSISKQNSCNECGTIFSEADEMCPNCGCPKEYIINNLNDTVKEHEKYSLVSNKNLKRIIFAIIVVLVLCLVGIIGFKVYNNKKADEKYNQYIDNLEKAKELMMIGGTDAESICIMTTAVWYNSIYEENDSITDEFTCPDGYFLEDFNDALTNYYMDMDTILTIGDIDSNIESVNLIMKELQDVPDGLENCYSTITDLNTAYTKLTGLAINPIGSYNDFNSNTNSSISDFLLSYNKLDLQIPVKSK